MYRVCLFLKETWLHSSVCSLLLSLWLRFGFLVSCFSGFWFGVSTSIFEVWSRSLLLLSVMDTFDMFVLLLVPRVCVTEACDAFVLLLLLSLLLHVCVTVAISTAREVSSAVFL